MSKLQIEDKSSNMVAGSSLESEKGDLRGKVLLCTLVDAPDPSSMRHRPDALVTVSQDGLITSIVEAGDPRHPDEMERADKDGLLVPLPGLLLPGFVDLHIHAPQYAQLGAALDIPLEDWLQRYTFPLEARFADLDFAKHVYDALVEDLLANGTTTAVYFATTHVPATKALADVCIEKGQRALVGKVVMDDPAECPDFYRDDDAETALRQTREVIRYIQDHPGNAAMVHPVVTPRFTPSCSDDALSGLGSLAREAGCYVQTHCSESDWQHAHALSRFGLSDAEALDGFGLLTDRTILAHGNLLSDDDFALLRERGSAVAHCACSNVYFSDSVFPLRRAIERHVRVGLGTDISGGPISSMFDGVRSTIAASRMLEHGVDGSLPRERRGVPGSRVDHVAAFHLATAGGADALGLPVGRFDVGQEVDAILVDPDAAGGSVRSWPGQTIEDRLQSLLMTASRPNIAAVWTRGRLRSGILPPTTPDN